MEDTEEDEDIGGVGISDILPDGGCVIPFWNKNPAELPYPISEVKVAAVM